MEWTAENQEKMEGKWDCPFRVFRVQIVAHKLNSYLWREGPVKWVVDQSWEHGSSPNTMASPPNKKVAHALNHALKSFCFDFIIYTYIYIY